MNNCPSAQVESQIGQVQDSFYNQFVTEAEQGQSVNVSVQLNVNSNCNPCYLSVGFAIENSPNFNSSARVFTNASNANPVDPLETVSGVYDVVISYTVPKNLSNIIMHYWQDDVVHHPLQEIQSRT
jgi:hypothetical protein